MKKALLLMSGGIDSPVAGYLMKKKGLDLISVHFSLEPLTDATAEQKSNLLSKKVGCSKFITIPFGPIQAEISKKCEHRFFYILTRRMMFRIAEILAKENDAEYLVTGENLGQVGSQTLPNLLSTTSAIKIPLLRPLLCLDKNEIIATARKIGTYEVSKGPEMCSVLGPKHPATTSKLEKIEEEEKNLDITDLIKTALEGITSEP